MLFGVQVIPLFVDVKTEETVPAATRDPSAEQASEFSDWFGGALDGVQVMPELVERVILPESLPATNRVPSAEQVTRLKLVTGVVQ
jgi:hypothetical protein